MVEDQRYYICGLCWSITEENRSKMTDGKIVGSSPHQAQRWICSAMPWVVRAQPPASMMQRPKRRLEQRRSGLGPFQMRLDILFWLYIIVYIRYLYTHVIICLYIYKCIYIYDIIHSVKHFLQLEFQWLLRTGVEEDIQQKMASLNVSTVWRKA